MLIKMLDGGLLNYNDNSYSYGGCPTCDYGSEYITEIYITLTKYKIYVKTNQMYEYALSEGDIMKLFLTNYNEIQAMTEIDFKEWLKKKLCEITHDSYDEVGNGVIIEQFVLTKVM